MPAEGKVETLGLEHLNFVAQQTVDEINAALKDMLKVEILPYGYQVVVEESAQFEDRFPCYVSDQRPAAIHFNTEQYDKLLGDFTTGTDITGEDVARTYIGCGISLKTLERSISPKDVNKVDRIYTIMSDINTICEAVKTSGFKERDQKDQLLTLMSSDEKIRCRINNLRFGVGVLLMAENARGNGDFVKRLSEALRNRMQMTLARKNSYISFLEGQGYDKNQAEDVFAEHITEVELAICFPMCEEEIRIILEICGQKDGEERVNPDMRVEQADIEQGFIVE